MKDLIFLAHRIPYPPNKGDKIRSWNVLQHLLKKFRVHLGCLIDDDEDLVHVGLLEECCASFFAAKLDRRWATLRSLGALSTGSALTFRYFWDRSLAAWVDAVHREREVSVQFVYSSAMAPYAERQSEFCGLRVVDFGDVDSDKWAQYAASKSWPARWIYSREARLLGKAERRISLRADASLLVTGAEADFFCRRTGVPKTRVAALSNGVDSEFFSPSHRLPTPYSPGGPVIVFTGAMDYWANVDAMLWFRDAILPTIRETVPDVRLAVVGVRPVPAVRRMAEDPSIVVTGRVEDVRPYVAHAAVAVAPLRIARGLQNKVLEAMAMGKAVVTTPQAFEGIEAQAGRELIVAADAPAFASAITRLLANDDALRLLGTRARQRVVESYSWERRLKVLDRILANSGTSAENLE